ncbi:MAG: S41 family peptidase [Lachnospiraceae bacterium]
MGVDQAGKGQKRFSGFLGGVFTGVAVSTVLVCLAFLIKTYVLDSSMEVRIDNQTIIVENSENTVIDVEFLSKIHTLEELIYDSFYLSEVTKEQLQEGMYDGMVDALGDIYSCYYTQEEYSAIMEQAEGVYYGIGAYVAMDSVTGYVKISSVIAGTPAEEAGLMADDLIYKIEGEDMAGLDSDQVVAKVKGEENTFVHLTLVRDGEEIEVDVERRKIESPTISYEIYEDGIGYIYISQFDDVTVDQFAEALAVLKGNDIEGLIIDVRGNPGGNLFTVVDIADMLLDEGLIVYTQDNYGNRDDYSSDSTHKYEDPVVMLINGNSASASEVLAGALKDYEAATLVGTTTFGKGIVQTLRKLADGTALKLTTSAYYTPNGNNIHGIGILPDVEVEFDSEGYLADGTDNQLEVAKEVLLELIIEAKEE